MTETCIRIKNTWIGVHTHHEWRILFFWMRRVRECGVYTNKRLWMKMRMSCVAQVNGPFICVTQPILICDASHAYTRPIRYEGGVYTNQKYTRRAYELRMALSLVWIRRVHEWGVYKKKRSSMCHSYMRTIHLCDATHFYVCDATYFYVWWISFLYSSNKIWRRRVYESRMVQCIFINWACIRISALALLLSHMLTSTLAILLSSSLPLVLSSPLLSFYLSLSLTIKHAQAAIDEAVTAAVDAVRLQTKNELEVPCLIICIHHTDFTSY